MLLSMTGFGDARDRTERLSAAVEIRAVNNRYLKVQIRCPDGLAPLEADIEAIIREKVARGTLSVVLRLDRPSQASQFSINHDVLQHYWVQIRHAAETLGTSLPHDVSPLLPLPGVVLEDEGLEFDHDADWPLIASVLNEALDRLHEFRHREGEAMRNDLLQQHATIKAVLGQVSEQAPVVVQEYRDKLLDRVRELVAELDVGVEPADLIREVSLFADRSDINEEITRLQCHLDQFAAFLDDEVSRGRKLDFLTQEINREVNTIGSKANNVQIAHHVVEMKAAVEKIREILQNVE